MSQNDFVIANASGASVRADMNSAFQAHASASSGATAPGTTYAYQYWFDTTLNIQKQRNGANTAWVNLWSLVGSTLKLYEQGALLLDRANTWSAEQTNLNGTRMGLPRGHIDGLTLSNSVADATNDIDIAAGSALSGGNDFDLALAATLTKRLDAAWAVGTNQGGLDAGSKAPDTWYHLWLIGRSDTGVVDALYSTSATAPSLPTNYDKKRRIGAVLTDSVAAPNSAILGFQQEGDFFQWDLIPDDVTVTNLGTTATSYVVSSPLGVSVRAVIAASAITSETAGIYVYSPLKTDQTAAGVRATVIGNRNLTQFVEILTDTSSQIRAVATSANTDLSLGCAGWFEPRGMNV